MGKYRYLFLAFFAFQFSFAQVELDSLGNVFYEDGLNDVWGYATDSREYALVGVRTGMSIVDVSEPTEPVELFFIPGMMSTWRDIKTWEDHAYCVNESGDGLLVVDLSNLPLSIEQHYTTLDDQFNSAHNIYIDENGIAYLVGYKDVANSIVRDDRGALFLDLTQDKWEPPVVGLYDDAYVHDIYVRDNIMYTSEIYEGVFSIVDISDLSAPQVLASKSTPYEFTHNAWLSDDGNYLFTTDERAGAYIGSYDISDFNDIQEIDRWRSSPGSDPVPHNAHVLDDWIVISYYTEGIRILNATRPDILVETAFYETTDISEPKFRGSWGAYPFLPSGNILASDRDYGLFVLGPSYQYPGYLTGTIVDSETFAPISPGSAKIEDMFSSETNIIGAYATGTIDTGIKSVEFDGYGYHPKTIDDVEILVGEETVLDVELDPMERFDGTVRFINKRTLLPEENVFNMFTDGIYEAESNSDAAGESLYTDIFDNVYTITHLKWGFQTANYAEVISLEDQVAEIDLLPAYYDDFLITETNGFNWTVENDENTVNGWVFTDSGDTGTDVPVSDSQSDFGTNMYVTGIGDGESNIVSDLDSGATRITSPNMELLDWNEPILQCRLFAYTTDYDLEQRGIEVWLNNGIESALLHTFPDTSTHEMAAWQQVTLPLDALDLTDEMSVTFIAYDLDDEADETMEAGLDKFIVYDDDPPPFPSGIEVTPSLPLVYPNPSNGDFTIQLGEWSNRELEVEVTDMKGRRVLSRSISDSNELQFGEKLIPGIYLVRLSGSDGTAWTQRLVKTP